MFNHENADFFLLHDIFLPSYPLAVEWMDFNPKDTETPGHYAALGYITNEIEIWDLNVSGCLEPTFRLGNKKFKKADRHSDAVLDLSWNKLTRFGPYSIFVARLLESPVASITKPIILFLQL